ncbi:hypothetical protein N7539_008424 [Penicillium diatomitis]|uniref:Uncharacterized protein n=1 Tax=Penicillium diatomitis TaxID=2819901 RepID=A0A9W9WU79_9EURO|nr:uncharacterized protein N7539_008424 [Penicillium diatomitis]KAJ5475358.1 hypothetical protein N7539_008424 [Penicillium diatomitis]
MTRGYAALHKKITHVVNWCGNPRLIVGQVPSRRRTQAPGWTLGGYLNSMNYGPGGQSLIQVGGQEELKVDRAGLEIAAAAVKGIYLATNILLMEPSAVE